MGTIQRRIFFTTTLITVLGLSALIGLSIQQLNNATLEFYQHDLQSEALTLAGNIGGVLDDEEEEGGQYVIEKWLTEHQTPGHHLMLLDGVGRVIADTNPTSIPDQRIQTPEIKAALEGLTAHYVRHDTAYTAAPITHDGRIIAVLRVSAPMQPAYDEARQHWLSFGLEAIPVLLLTIIATIWLGRTIVRPVKRLNEAALHMAGGALDERIVVESKDEIGQLGQSFNYMAEQIEQLIARQQRFVSDAAHELRNPLMSLKLRVQALLNEGLPPEEATQYLQDMETEINRLSHLVTELLALARLDEKRQADAVEQIDLAAFLQDIARQTELQTQAAQLHFEFDCPTNFPDLWMSSADLRIILDNLLSNAIKYTPTGGAIRLVAKAAPEMLILEVQDTGEGFEPANQAHLFDRFFRVDRSRNRQVAGTGLGLAITKGVVEKYRGSISAYSAGVGQGALFTVTLPLTTIP